ncbi:MAG: RagB/SusD family nutrient uptake outer membrane protein [Prolixibacteraceae bacterium]|jgi:hypothetical protein|nr:RagB/SusD family nutrient uptake outer membrane protein [Prolixibacteraceae bacterium]
MKRNLYILIIVAAMLSFYSCSDFMEADNKSNVTSDEFFNTEAGFETLANYAYAQLKPLYDGAPTIHSSGTDLYVEGRNSMPDNALHVYSGLNPENATVRDYYINCYEAIQAANCVLFYAGTTDAKDEIIKLRSAEARFIRSFIYLEMVQHFGGVAIVDEYVNSIVTNVPRESTESVYEFIISELEALKDSPLPNTDLSGRVTKQAVYHYLAKAYLTAGWDLDKNDYFSTAASHAEEALALGNGLNESFNDLWWPSKDNTHDEVVFALQYDRVSSSGAGIAEADNGNGLQSYHTQYLGGAEQNYRHGSSNFIPTTRLMMLFEEGDSRYEGSFMTHLYCTDLETRRNSGDYYAMYNGNSSDRFVAFYYPPHYASSETDIAAWKAEDPDNRNDAIVVPMSENTVLPSGKETSLYEAATPGEVFSFVPVRKFDDPASSYDNSTCYRDIVLARLAETYLIASEAYLKAGSQGKADDMLNMVRERAFSGSSVSYEKSNVTIDDILEERALELLGERKRWTDLRRTKKLVEYNVQYNDDLGGDIDAFTGNDGNQKILRPIPQNAIDLNEADVQQNPGYSTGVDANDEE